MKDYIREFPQPDGSTMICEVRGGVRQPTRYVRDGKELTLPPKEPRRIPPKRTGQPAAGKPERATPKRETRYDCAHIEGSTGQTTKHLCGGCPGGQIATIFTCELFGECLPAAWAETPETTARRCLDCGKYEPETEDQ